MNASNLTSYYFRNGKKEMMVLQLALSVIFIVSPLAGLLITIIITWVLNTWHLSKFTTLLLAVFIWCIESTRTFSMGELGDFPGYMTMFDSLGGTPLLRLVFSPSSSTVITPGNTTVEYGWQVFNRVGYFIFGGNFFCFAYFVIASSYLLIFISIHMYMRSIGADYRYYLCAIIFLAFLAPYFSICNNLFRQQMAMSLVVYTFVVKVVDHKFKWCVFLIAVSFHMMCIAFLPFLFFKLYRKPSFKLICLFFVCFLLLFFVIQRLGILAFIGIGIIQKLANASEYAGADIIETIATIKYFAIILIIYIFIIIQKRINANTIYFLNTILIMSALYILLDPLPLVQTRYYITRFVFLPFVIPFLLGYKNLYSSIYTCFVILISINMFFTADFNQLFKFEFDDILSRCIFDYNLF